jgi:hypothetical protein
MVLLHSRDQPTQHNTWQPQRQKMQNYTLLLLWRHGRDDQPAHVGTCACTDHDPWRRRRGRSRSNGNGSARWTLCRAMLTASSS